MEEHQRIDLTYITERIITVSFPRACPEHTYLQNLCDITHMLESKHGHNYLLINLSERSNALNYSTHKVLDTGWQEFLAPTLDQMCSVCTAMGNWLQAHPKHVLLLHCKGEIGRIGVALASYMHFTNISASAGLSLDHFVMKRFYNDKVSSLMTPSQKRYVWMLGSVLKGVIRLSSSPSFLLCVVVHGIPESRPEGGSSLFLRVYQSLQAVCTSAVYHVQAGQTDRLYIVLQPAQLLKGDIMVVCYDKNSQTACRQVVFSVQFHTGIIYGHTLTFSKVDLDHAHTDCRFPDDSRVELVFSDSPESVAGRELWHNQNTVTVDYDTLDPLDRWDSYHIISAADTALPPVLGPVDGSLYARVRKHRSQETPPTLPLQSASRDPQKARGVAHPDRLTLGRRLELAPGEVMAERWGSSVAAGELSVAEPHSEGSLNGEARPSRQQTDTLDDKGDMFHVGAPSSASSSWQQRAPATAHPSQVNGGPGKQEGQEQDLAALATDMDQSIEQLNQLILELDPTFVPVHTTCAPLHASGLSHRGRAYMSGWLQQRQTSDVTDCCGPRSPERTGGTETFNSPVHSSQHWALSYSVDSGDLTGISPATPSFPVSPPTPYVKNSEFSLITPEGQWESNRILQDSRIFLDGMSNSGGSMARRELFRSNMSVTPGQRLFGSMSSVSSDSPQPHPSSATTWQDQTPSSLSSPMQPSPPLSLSSPPTQQGLDLSSVLGNGGLERCLLEAMEGLGSLSMGMGLDDRGLPPLLPEKRRGAEGLELGSRSPSLSGFSSPGSSSSTSIFSSATPDPLRELSFSGVPSPGAESSVSKQDTVKFVQDTSKFWYKPDISRDQAIVVLKDKETGSFIVRDSHSFRGAYGLAVKVATPPPLVLQQSKKMGDLSSELVRHFLIECTPKGVRLKGCPNEPYFGSLTALVCQHSITPLALPCKLILPDRDPMEEMSDSTLPTATNSAAELLKQGAACNVWYLGSVELESLTGQQAVQKATSQTLAMDPPPTSTVVHFKVSSQGITLTDNQRKLFFRRHYTVNTVIFCSLDPQGRKWMRGSGSTAKMFGFVARKSQSGTENICHLFAEHDPEQPASAIVNFVSKVMIGSHKK